MSELEKLMKRVLAKFSRERTAARLKGEQPRFKKLNKLMSKIEGAPLGLAPGPRGGEYFVIGNDDRRTILDLDLALLRHSAAQPTTATKPAHTLPDPAFLAQLEQIEKEKPRRTTTTTRKTSNKG